MTQLLAIMGVTCRFTELDRKKFQSLSKDFNSLKLSVGGNGNLGRSQSPNTETLHCQKLAQSFWALFPSEAHAVSKSPSATFLLSFVRLLPSWTPFGQKFRLNNLYFDRAAICLSGVCKSSRTCAGRLSVLHAHSRLMIDLNSTSRLKCLLPRGTGKQASHAHSRIPSCDSHSFIYVQITSSLHHAACRHPSAETQTVATQTTGC